MNNRLNCSLMKLRAVVGMLAVSCALGTAVRARGQSDVVRGADELFWVPTLERGIEAAGVTGKPFFVIGFSLVDQRSTFTKLGPEYPACVF
jgi:hypothetical protein